jgi:hypothetical protein
MQSRIDRTPPKRESDAYKSDPCRSNTDWRFAGALLSASAAIGSLDGVFDADQRSAVVPCFAAISISCRKSGTNWPLTLTHFPDMAPSIRCSGAMEHLSCSGRRLVSRGVAGGFRLPARILVISILSKASIANRAKALTLAIGFQNQVSPAGHQPTPSYCVLIADELLTNY